MGHCEQDEHAERSYRALFDTRGEWFCEDIRKADPNDIPGFDLLCRGFPCQSFSIAGSRRGFADPRGTLFFEIARLTEAKRPAYLLLENVPYALQRIRNIMSRNQLCTSPPENSGAERFTPVPLCMIVDLDVRYNLSLSLGEYK